MSINETKCFYCDVIIIKMQNDVSQQNKTDLYINPNTEIELEWIELASHFLFAALVLILR